MKPKIIILNGKGGSGKTSLQRCIKFYDMGNTQKKRIAYTSMVEKVKEIATLCGWQGQKEDKDRAFLHDLKILLQEYNDLPYISVCQFIEKCGIGSNGEIFYPYVFVDAREVEDIERLVKDFAATTVLVRRFDRTYGNEADDNVENWNYDYIIENTGTFDDLRAAAETFWDEFTRADRYKDYMNWESFEIKNLEILKGELE